MKRSIARTEIAVAAAGFLAALLLRAAFLASLRENYDFTSWRIVVDILRRSGELFRETSRYNYSPLWAGILLGLDGLGRSLGLSLPRLISLFLLSVDLATAALLCAIALQRGRRMPRALFCALIFLANPISVIVSSFLGMFDNLSLFFLLLALFYAGKKPAGAKASTVGALCLSLIAKHVTWFHPLLFARRREGMRLSWPAALSTYGIFLLSFAPFWRQWEGIRAHVFGYRGLDEPYGIEPLRSILWLPRETTTVLFVLAALASVALLDRVELGRASLILVLVVLIFTPGICPYYFVWPIALGALYPSLGYLVYTVIVTGFFVHSPDVLSVELSHLPGWWGVWWALIFWLLWEIRAIQRERLRAARVS